MQLLPMASSPDGLISARYAVSWGGGAAVTRIRTHHKNLSTLECTHVV